MHKTIHTLIQIDHSEFLLKSDTSLTSTCEKCYFNDSSCPKDLEGRLLCDDSNLDLYFVPAPSTSLVEDFKEAAGITTEQSFTESQIRDAYADWHSISMEDGEAERFIAHIKKFSDPEYKEFLRLKEKFTY